MPHLNVRRIVTGHDGEGNAVIREDKTMETRVLGAEAEMVLAWTTAVFPSDNSDDADGALREVRRVSPGGSVLQLVTMHPHTASKHHRTQSLDYGIVLEGDITLQLDDGVETVCHPGDVVIQRGTIHTWRNDTDAPTKVAFILLDARPIEVGGMVLEPEN